MSEEKALTVAEEQEILAKMDLGIAGEENLQQGDIGMPPRLRISQRNRPIKVGDGEAPAGSIVNTLTGEIFERGLEIVPLVFLPRTRVMWPEVFSADNSPECASDDGEHSAVSSDVRALIRPRPGPCADCELGKFGEDGTPPRCKLQRNFLVWLVEQSEPAILTMQSTALSPARQLTTLAKTQGLRKSIRFATRNVESDQGNWHVPAFSKGRRLTVDEIVALAEARDELRNLIITADVAEEMRENGGEDALPDQEPEDLPF